MKSNNKKILLIRDPEQFKTGVVLDNFSEKKESGYNKSELKSILKQRIKTCFLNSRSLPNRILEKIAETVEIENDGNYCLALDIVFNSAVEAENENKNKIQDKHVLKILTSTIDNFDKKLVSRLEDSKLIVLYAICDNADIIHFNDLYEDYKNIISYYTTLNNEKIKFKFLETISELYDFDIIDMPPFPVILEDMKGMLRLKSKVDETIVLDELKKRDLLI